MEQQLRFSVPLCSHIISYTATDGEHNMMLFFFFPRGTKHLRETTSYQYLHAAPIKRQQLFLHHLFLTEIKECFDPFQTKSKKSKLCLQYQLAQKAKSDAVKHVCGKGWQKFSLPHQAIQNALLVIPYAILFYTSKFFPSQLLTDRLTPQSSPAHKLTSGNNFMQQYFLLQIQRMHS